MEIATRVPQIPQLTQFCESLAEIGFRYLELGNGILSNYSKAEIEKLSHVLNRNKMEIFSVHAPFLPTIDLSSVDNAQRNKTLYFHQKVIDKMQVFGTSILVIHPGGELQGKDIKTRLDMFRRSLEYLLPRVQKDNITLAIENLPPGHVGNKAEDLRDIIKEFQSNHLGICFDTGHAHVGGRLKECFDKLREFIVTFHIHDNEGSEDMHLQPPYGSIQWEQFISWVRAMSFPNPLVMECYPWGMVEYKWAKTEIELLFEGKMIRAHCFPSGYVRCPVCGRFFFEYRKKAVCYCSFKRGEIIL